MRSMISALVCIAAVACGTLLTRLDLSGLLVPISMLALVLGLAFAAAGPPRPERIERLGVALLLCAGLVRGAAAQPPEPPRVPERGPSGAQSQGFEPQEFELQEFELRGASEPGPRCRFEVLAGEATLSLSAPPDDCPLAHGDRVAISTSALRPHWSARISEDPTEIDLGPGPVLWRRADTHASAPGLDSITRGYWRWVAHRRQQAWTDSRGDDAASLVFAAGLGLRTALEPERREQLRAAGLGHLIAVSGLHIAIAGLWLQALARRSAALAGVSARWACVLAWLPLWGYVGLTGAAASAVRAAAMASAIDLGVLVGRPSHAPTLLASVAAGMLLWQPQWLLDPGFALSLAAMAAIVTAPDELGVLAMSWRITCTTAPLSVLLFDAAPLHGLLGNALALPLFGLMMPPALFASIADGQLATLALALARCFATPILDLAASLARWPSAGPGTLAILGALGLLAHLWPRPSSGAVPAWPRLRKCVPPRLACVLALLVSAGMASRDAQSPGPSHTDSVRFDWIALGSVHSRALLVADTSTPGRACLYRPTGSSTTWIWLFEQYGVRELSRLDADLPKAEAPTTPRSDPRTRALAARLVEAGIIVHEGEGICTPPPAALVRARLRACRQLDPRKPALVRSWADIEACAFEDRWITIVDH